MSKQKSLGILTILSILPPIWFKILKGLYARVTELANYIPSRLF